MAVIVAGHGTVFLRNDGSVMVTDRNRTTYCIDASIAQAIGELLAKVEHERKEQGRATAVSADR